MPYPMKRLPLLLLLAAWVVPATAQRTLSDDPWCTERNDYSDADRACEVREFTLDTRRTLAVDAGDNGGISVEAWDRDEVLVRARIQAKGESRAEARRLVEQVEIETDRTIRPRVPSARRDAWASVSFRVMVPRRSGLDLKAQNGGIGIDGVMGDIQFDTQNGGVSLDGVGGDVRGRTTNGGLSVTLTGTRWDGERLDVETTNGGVRLVVPDDYSADLETGTVNGGLRLGFPVTVEGDVGRRVRTRLGNGGAPVRAVTTNGGVVIERG
jgi:hypothetical protein